MGGGVYVNIGKPCDWLVWDESSFQIQDYQSKAETKPTCVWNSVPRGQLSVQLSLLPANTVAVSSEGFSMFCYITFLPSICLCFTN